VTHSSALKALRRICDRRGLTLSLRREHGLYVVTAGTARAAGSDALPVIQAVRAKLLAAMPRHIGAPFGNRNAASGAAS
jgi:hypothetical protein